MLKMGTGLLAMNADLPFPCKRHETIAAPGTKGSGERVQGIQALGTNGQNGDIGEGSVTETAVGGKQRREEALGDKAERSRHGSLSLAYAVGSG